VLDLPNLSFRSTDPTESSDLDEWFEASLEVNGVSESIHYRPAFYRGNRDSDPRVAQACLLAWSDKSDPNSYSPACVIVNIHLSTLTTELRKDRTIHGRLTSAEAIFLRGAQLDLIARYVREVQELADGIPIVIAGDFNAEPDSPEMISFANKTGSPALLSPGICWKCGTLQKERPEVSFYAQSENGWDLTMNPQSPDGNPFKWKLDTRAVCSNDECMEVRFTHKWHQQLFDNVFVLPARSESPWEVASGTPRVDPGWDYSDHAAIIVPLKFSKRFESLHR